LVCTYLFLYCIPKVFAIQSKRNPWSQKQVLE
jgi:hypothetical protein